MNILWQHTDGSLVVTHISPDHDETPEEHAKTLQEHGDVPAAYTPVAYAVEDLPDHLPVEVWELQGEKIGVHIGKAREWHKARLRRQRAPHLAALDVQSLRNTESGADNAATLKAKQKLRDVTKAVDAAASWEAMSAITVP